MTLGQTIRRTTVLTLGCSQLMCWGITYYLIGVFGEAMAVSLGWSLTLLHAGFTWALLVMGFASARVGRAIDRHGGRPVMSAGSVLIAAGCALLAMTNGLVIYFAAWTLLGFAMRMTLYDAAFAALARIGGSSARRPMSQITLLGGLASTVFWPIGHVLAETLGWRGAVLAYAAIALVVTLPIHLMLPPGKPAGPVPQTHASASAGPGPTRWGQADILFALLMTLFASLNTAMSAHMISLLAGLGLGATAVSVASLRGIGQFSSRFAEVLFGARLHPLQLGIVAAGITAVSFLAGLAGGTSVAMGAAFALLYGAGNGLATITRGSLPLILFGSTGYGRTAGRLLAPSFYLSALAPALLALVMDWSGPIPAILLCLAMAALALAIMVVLARVAERP